MRSRCPIRVCSRRTAGRNRNKKMGSMNNMGLVLSGARGESERHIRLAKLFDVRLSLLNHDSFFGDLFFGSQGSMIRIEAPHPLGLEPGTIGLNVRFLVR